MDKTEELRNFCVSENWGSDNRGSDNQGSDNQGSDKQGGTVLWKSTLPQEQLSF